MNKYTRQLIVVIIFSIVLSFGAVILIYLDPNPDQTGQILTYIWLPIWIFSIIPAYIFWINWFNSKSFEQGVWIGLVLRVGLFILPILIAPFLAVKYFIFIAKNIKNENSTG
ncbi:hypothetical protein LJC17_03220 [Acholeplasma sp. OttesenSCG-928-E16]|nr:hypothetical protein [Acholeplasma sp. OttesenSCG-928-E16]